MSFRSYVDPDPLETQEWREAIDSAIEREGHDRATWLLSEAVKAAYQAGAPLPDTNRTPYLNTIPAHREKPYPGDIELESKAQALIRWNALAMVVKANRLPAKPGGHIASFQSSAHLYEIGFNHFWRAPKDGLPGDMIYFQGHASPGIYSRAFVEGRLTEEQLHHFRREIQGKGLSSYPHPWLMPTFWQFPTVSMGLGPITAIYQARFMKYLENREIIPRSDRKVWAFLGDGEMDEPESQGAIGLAARENLDNLIFVVNCNLQRLDGPVRGNSSIVQELEGNFRGAGWNVIKVLWGSGWDKLLAQDFNGFLKRRFEECVDGEYQNFRAHRGEYIRENFFGKYPELRRMVEHMTDDQIFYGLLRGGHDRNKVYNAYLKATQSEGKPTLILAKTVKGYGMGGAGEGLNITHQQKSMAEEELRAFRDRFDIPLTDEQLKDPPFLKLDPDSPEAKYLHERRTQLGGYLPKRRTNVEGPMELMPLSKFKLMFQDSGQRTLSTTMAIVRILATIGRDKNIGPRLVPIIADEARTFGMEGMFRQLGIYAHEGQKYTPIDAMEVMPYREDIKGQILQEGICEAGSMSSWIAAGTSYSNYGKQMIPVYLFYSMFGFQRIGDLAWAAGDSRTRGFLIGGTSGRTTLNGEGLQHQDGNSHLFAHAVPNCISYDPTFQYEVAVIFYNGLKRMYVDQEDIYYYITAMNENYHHPAMPEGVEEGIIKGMYKFSSSDAEGPRVQLMGSGTILRESIAAAELLANDFGIAADVWSVTSFNELARDGQDALRWNRFHPEDTPRKSYVTQCLEEAEGPVVACTDYIKLYAEQIRAFVPGSYHTLGTDGFGRSDSREQLRSYFEVDRYHIACTALSALAQDGTIPGAIVSEALKKYNISPDKPSPDLT
jgi:pyruvate dehydrogenase E1 component